MQGLAGQRQSQASNALAGWHGSGSQAAAPQQQVGHISCTLAPVPDLGSPVYYSASHSFDAERRSLILSFHQCRHAALLPIDARSSHMMLASPLTTLLPFCLCLSYHTGDLLTLHSNAAELNSRCTGFA